MPTKFPLYESKPAVAAATGRAVATLQPLRAYERWNIRKVSIQCQSPLSVGAAVPIFKLYRNSEAPMNLIEGTLTGDLNSSDMDIWLETGEALIGVWSGADVNSQASMTIQGDRLNGV